MQQPSIESTIKTLQRCIDAGGAMASVARFKLDQLKMHRTEAIAVSNRYSPGPHARRTAPPTLRVLPSLRTENAAPSTVPMTADQYRARYAEIMTRQKVLERNQAVKDLETQYRLSHCTSESAATIREALRLGSDDKHVKSGRLEAYKRDPKNLYEPAHREFLAV